MSEQLRLPCTLHGRYDEHLFTEYDGSTDRVEVKTCPGGHPVAGEKVWWCEEHPSGLTGVNEMPIACDFAAWRTELRLYITPCRMVERFLIPLSNPETTK